MADSRAAVSLTVRVSLQERIEYLEVTRDLLPGPSLASQLVNILGNQLISPVRFASFGPLSSTHGRVCFESYITLSATYSFRLRITFSMTYPAEKHLPAHQTRPVPRPFQYLAEGEPDIPSTFET